MTRGSKLKETLIKSLPEKQDQRPKRRGWAPGKYLCRCTQPECSIVPDRFGDRTFIGDKRAWMCADCAYALPEPAPTPQVPYATRADLVAALEQIRDTPCTMANDAESLRHTIKVLRHIAESVLKRA